MTGVVTATIMKDSSSEVMNPQYILLSIDILKEVNKIPTAQLVLLDGDPATQTFAVSQSNFFTPGEKNHAFNCATKRKMTLPFSLAIL